MSKSKTEKLLLSTNTCMAQSGSDIGYSTCMHSLDRKIMHLMTTAQKPNMMVQGKNMDILFAVHPH